MLTDEQKRMRLEGVGGSEAPAIAGESPFAGPHDVWLTKMGQAPEFRETGHIRRGNYYEAPTADWLAQETGAELTEVGTITHPSISRVLCTPDRIAKYPDGSRGVVSIKVPDISNPKLRESWGEPGSEDVPVYAWLQLQWELLVCEARYGITSGCVVAPFVGEDGGLGIYPIRADRETQQNMVQLVHDWWRKYVDTKTPPPVDGTESSTRFLKARYPRNLAPMLVATPTADALMRKLSDLRKSGKRCEEEEEAVLNQLKELLGENEGMQGDGWKILWRAHKPGTFVDYEALAKELKPDPELVRKHTRPKTPVRPFLPTWKTK